VSAPEHQLQDGLLTESVRDDVKAPALLYEETLKQIRGPNRAAMRHRKTQVGNASPKVVHEGDDGALAVFAVVRHQSGGDFACDRPARGVTARMPSTRHGGTVDLISVADQVMWSLF
jgi:hypothetical protein